MSAEFLKQTPESDDVTPSGKLHPTVVALVSKAYLIQTNELPSNCSRCQANSTERKFIVRAEKILTAFVELERAIHQFALSLLL